MANIIPQEVLPNIQRHLVEGIENAEYGYRFHYADEDAITGALGQALLSRPTFVSSPNGELYTWSTTYYKIRGRGPGAPEKYIGADGIFQIEVLNREGQIVGRKGLLFQSKKEWVEKDNKLGDQVTQLPMQMFEGIVIDYEEGGYYACSSAVVAEARGDRRKIPANNFRPLTDVVGFDFPACRIGARDLFYDDSEERLVSPPGTLAAFAENATVIETKVRRIL